MKSFYKKTLILFLLLVGTFINSKKAYASEFNVSGFPEKDIENLKGNDKLIVADSKIVTALKATIPVGDNTTLFCTSDTPDNIVELMTLNAANYEVVPYSYTKIINTTTAWGNKLVKFLTIEVSGEVYVYRDGKVHLYSMWTKATPHQSGWNVSYDFNGLCNTDGSVSIGYSYVYCTKLDVEYKFACSVSIYKMDTKPTVTIEQVY